MKNMLLSGLLVILVYLPASGQPKWVFDIESGVAINGYNDVQIPGDIGTRISLSEQMEADPAYFWRFRLTYHFNQKHLLSALIAPLRLNSEGSFAQPVYFYDREFPAGTPLTGHYRFDSYRVTYRYNFHNRQRLTMGIGVTAKIRDAAISLESVDERAEKTNTGLVPLINFSLKWQFHNRLNLIFEGDGLAAPQGRAEDFLLAVNGRLTNNLDFRLGYRLLEGGADNDEVYNFTLVNYYVAGLSLNF